MQVNYPYFCFAHLTFPVKAYTNQLGLSTVFMFQTSFAPDNWDAFMDTSPLLVIPDLALYESHVSLFRTLESIAKQPHLR